MAGFLGTETDGEVLLKGARGLGVDFFCGKGFFKEESLDFGGETEDSCDLSAKFGFRVCVCPGCFGTTVGFVEGCVLTGAVLGADLKGFFKKGSLGPTDRLGSGLILSPDFAFNFCAGVFLINGFGFGIDVTLASGFFAGDLGFGLAFVGAFWDG